MTMHRRIAMGSVRAVGGALVLFGSLVFCASSAWGQPPQPCTPVVYAFRHAEDTNPPNPPGPIFALTPTGEAHAKLYVDMVLNSNYFNGFCDVTKVYATTKVKKVGSCGANCDSATNAFDTATPLATWAMSADPITTVGAAKNQLYEYLGNGNDTPANPNYSTVTATALREELLATANRGQSSAIFWTSDGLHVLGGAIINANSNVPPKPPKGDPRRGTTPPRNAVYLFKAVGSAPNIAGFADTPVTPATPTHPVPSAVYVQCFNHVESTDQPSDQLDLKSARFIPARDPLTQEFYCGYDYQSNLGGKPDDSCEVGAQCGSSIENDENQFIKGWICNTTITNGSLGTMFPNKTGPGIFGVCWGLP
jgi:hypothetical protein